uniref:Uncharacterized protein n=1 Tax=Oryza sativa subsp. japonica TaxID=39947 RepID=Q6ETA6_ORYSJ|nr:hypothetical protein [Oryza sativa Japonica Group]
MACVRASCAVVRSSCGWIRRRRRRGDDDDDAGRPLVAVSIDLASSARASAGLHRLLLHRPPCRPPPGAALHARPPPPSDPATAGRLLSQIRHARPPLLPPGCYRARPPPPPPPGLLRMGRREEEEMRKRKRMRRGGGRGRVRGEEEEEIMSSNQLGSEALTEFCAAVAIAGSQRVDAHLRAGGFRGLSASCPPWLPNASLSHRIKRRGGRGHSRYRPRGLPPPLWPDLAERRVRLLPLLPLPGR